MLRLLVFAFAALLASAAALAGASAMRQPGPSAPSAAVTMTCGGEPISVAASGDTARVTIGARTIEMRKMVSASGAKYEAIGDSTTTFWSQGERATLVVSGTSLPECKGQGAATSFTALGNEPGWRLDIANGTLTLLTDSGATRTSMAVPAPRPIPGGRVYEGTVGGRQVVVTVLDRTCGDSMTGMPRPNVVEVQMEGKTLKGCGGDPASLLQGPPWVAASIAGAPIIPGSRVTLEFKEGRVAGSSGCNHYTGPYTLTGEGLRVGPTAGTRMACPEPLMEQEQAFLKVLGGLQRFEITPDGGLVLHAADGSTVVARRP